MKKYNLKNLNERQKALFKNYIKANGEENADVILNLLESGLSIIQSIQAAKRIKK